MTDSDFENRLRRLMNEQVDARLGPERPAPASLARTASRSSARRHGMRWLPPLLAAACVAIIVGGSVAGAQLLSADRHPAGPVRPTVHTGPSSSSVPGTGSPATPTTRTTPTDTNSGTATAPTTGSKPPKTSTTTKSRTTTTTSRPPDYATVQVGAATIGLPTGWEARDLRRYAAPGSSFGATGWCLAKKSDPVVVDGCHLNLFAFDAQSLGRIDVDNEGGFYGNPHPCGEGTGPVEETAADLPFGGRTADYRRWVWHCPTGTKYFEQYVVATGPAYILSSDTATPDVQAVMNTVVAHASLPAQDRPVRLSDYGIVRSATQTGKYVHIELDREIRASGDGGDRNTNPKTYPYDIPIGLWRDQGAVHVGTTVQLYSNGTRVEEFYPA